VVSVGAILRVITDIIFGAIFAGDDREFKHVPAALTLSLAVAQSYLASACGPLGIAVSLATLVALHARASTLKTLAYSLALTSIPAVWYFLTSLPFTLSVTRSALAAFRVIAIGSASLAFLYFLNPLDISVALKRFGKGASVYPSLTWKVVPHVMRDMQSSMLAAELKGERLWRAVAVTTLAVSEYSDYYEEGLYSKLRLFNPRNWYSAKAVTTYSALLAVCVVAAAIITVTHCY